LAGHDATHRFLREIIESADPERLCSSDCVTANNYRVSMRPFTVMANPFTVTEIRRARAHLRYCSEVLADDEGFKRLTRALAIVREARNLEPNNALVCLFILRRLGWSRTSTLFN